MSPDRDLRQLRWFGLAISAVAAGAAFIGSARSDLMLGLAAWSATFWLTVTRTPRYAAAALRGGRLLRQGFWPRWVSPLLLPGPLIAAVVAMEVSSPVPGGWLAPVMFVILISITLAQAVGVRFTYWFDSTGIELRAPWSLWTREVSWGAIIGIRQCRTRAGHFFVLARAGGKSLRIAQQMDGIGDFAAAALRHLSPDVLDAQPGLRGRLTDLAGRV